MQEIKKVAIVGMGALGLLYAAEISRHNPDCALCFVADLKRAEQLRASVQTVNGVPVHFPILSEEEATPVDLLIIALKYPALSAALDTFRGCIGEDTIVLSVMNGVVSEEIIAERYPRAKVLHCVAQGMDATKIGNDLTYVHAGQVRVGCLHPGQQPTLERLTAFFDASGIAYVVEPDIRHRLWSKFMLNVGVNQTCMVFDVTYGGVFDGGEAEKTLYAAFREAVAVANAESVQLSEEDIEDAVRILHGVDPAGMPSMRQDRLNRKPSEVDMFAGTVIALGRKHGIPVPVNEWLYQRVKEIEAGYGRDA